MRLISNQNYAHHLSEIKKQISTYDEVYLAIAFLKTKGLLQLLPSIKKHLKSNGKIAVIAGQHFALTQPEALDTLRKLFKNNMNAKIYLANATSASRVFHPKLYLFKRKNDCRIIAGSAYVTNGGLVSNTECSLEVDCLSSDKVWKDAKKFFENLLLPENSEEVTLLTIKRYESYYKPQKANQKKVKPIPVRKKSQLDFNYDNLKNHFMRFHNKEWDREYEKKVNNYREAKKVLDKIANIKSISKKEFAPLLDALVGSKGKPGMWKSGSLFRLRRNVYPYFKEFQKLVKYIRENKNQKPGILFTKANKLVNPIEGASVNYVTEIMMTYNPSRFANMNKNPITVLRKEGDVNIKATSSSFNGDDYEEYCELVKEISTKLGLKNMLEADSLFNEIYWKIDKKKKK